MVVYLSPVPSFFFSSHSTVQTLSSLKRHVVRFFANIVIWKVTILTTVSNGNAVVAMAMVETVVVVSLMTRLNFIDDHNERVAGSNDDTKKCVNEYRMDDLRGCCYCN